MYETVVFLGAGATKSVGGPLTYEILPHIHAATPSGDVNMQQLGSFLTDVFHVKPGDPPERYPGLPLVMSLIDTALDRGQDLGGGWTFEALRTLRQSIEFGIWEVLERKLQTGATNNHYALLYRLFTRAGGLPAVISTNYDLIADTAMMFLGSNNGGDWRLPDYRCALDTRSGLGATDTFGVLLKLDGSLHWLHCRTCGRLELGSSDSIHYGTALAHARGVAAALSPDGAPCSVCGTPLRPLLVAPTHRKDYRNPHLAQVWFEAERLLRAAKHVVFIGYSLPDDDVEVVYLLKRTLSRPGVRVTVVEHDLNPSRAIGDHPAGRRYRALFGDTVEWFACGLDGWLSRPDVPAAQ